MLVFIYMKHFGNRMIKKNSVNKNLFILSSGFLVYISFLILNMAMVMLNIFNNVQMKIKDINSVRNLLLVIGFISLLFVVNYVYLKNKIQLNIDQLDIVEKSKIIKSLGFISVSLGSVLGITIGRVFGGKKIVIIISCVLSAIIAQVLIAFAVFYAVIYLSIKE